MNTEPRMPQANLSTLPVEEQAPIVEQMPAQNWQAAPVAVEAAPATQPAAASESLDDSLNESLNALKNTFGGPLPENPVVSPVEVAPVAELKSSIDLSSEPSIDSQIAASEVPVLPSAEQSVESQSLPEAAPVADYEMPKSVDTEKGDSEVETLKARIENLEATVANLEAKAASTDSFRKTLGDFLKASMQ